MKFDAYWATFWGERGESGGVFHERFFHGVMDQIAVRIGAEIRTAARGLPGGYGQCYQLVKDEEVICHMLTGGSGAAFGSHQMRVQGAWSPDLTELIRELVPAHGVSRVDIASDYCAPGLFEKVVEQAEAIGKNHRVKLERVGEGWYPHQKDKGRTLYVGSRQSVVFLRIYERGKKLLGEGVDADPNYIRIEAEIKPKSSAKGLLAHLEPEVYFGCSNWLKELAMWLGASDMERVKVGTVWRKSDQERLVNHLGRQYWDALKMLKGSMGSAQAVFEAIEKANTSIKDTRGVLRRLRESEGVKNIMEEVENA